ncbi:MAG: AraC family transcriptional regulator [Pseudomonadota bacterium]
MDATDQAPGHALLDQVLQEFRLETRLFWRGRMCGGGWVVDDRYGHGRAAFHLLVSGEAWLHMTGLPEPVQLVAGDLVIFPTDAEHALRPGPHARTDWSDGRERALADDSEPGAGLVCGNFGFADTGNMRLLAALPDHVIVRAVQKGPARALVEALFAEARGAEAASGAVVERIADALFLVVLRDQLAGTAQSGLLAALRDPGLARALAAIHEHPARPWSVEDLARLASLSRSAFAARFHRQVGEPPLAYLTRWRMQLARRWLRAGEAVPAIAARCGYDSEASFAKAFKRIHGLGPGASRRQT